MQTVHMKTIRLTPLSFSRLYLLTVMLFLALGACSTTAKKDKAPDNAQSTPSAQSSPHPGEKPSFPPITFAHPGGPAGDLLRALGTQAGGGFVLMSGLEERAVPAVDFKQEPYDQAITRFAESIPSVCTSTPYYYLILPPDYDALQQVDLAETLDPIYHNIKAGAVFGAKTPLFAVFSALSTSLDITILADNYIAESRCGELHLPELPLPVLLAAVLQSARISTDAFIVENTPEYIFFRAPRNENPPSVRIESTSPPPDAQALLDKTVSLTLPPLEDSQNQFVIASEPMPLNEVLYPLTKQLGIEVVAERRLADIPINPCVFRNVRLSTALDLLVRQWPLAQFGWELQPGRILLKQR